MYLVGEVSVGDMSGWGSVCRGCVWSGKCPSGNCPDAIYYIVEVPKDKFNNLINSERKALYDLKNDKSIVIKSADKGSAVVVLDREDYIIEAGKQLGDEEFYEEELRRRTSSENH